MHTNLTAHFAYYTRQDIIHWIESGPSRLSGRFVRTPPPNPQPTGMVYWIKTWVLAFHPIFCSDVYVHVKAVTVLSSRLVDCCRIPVDFMCKLAITFSQGRRNLDLVEGAKTYD